MKIQKIIDTKDGPVTYVAELSQDQFNFIFEVGMKFLIDNGVEFFQMKEAMNVASIAPASEEMQ